MTKNYQIKKPDKLGLFKLCFRLGDLEMKKDNSMNIHTQNHLVSFPYNFEGNSFS